MLAAKPCKAVFTMKTLQVDLEERSYPIYIGAGLLRCPELLTPYISGRQVLVVTNKTVAPLYLEALTSSLTSFQCKELVLPDGEEYKNLETLNRIFDALLEHRFNRGCTLIALGGGVVGDITGFAAASYQRGVSLIQIPTTLLAQVDSSVGGKTGINHRLGKNMIGAFYQPQCVLADTATLDTLDDRQFHAGLAEVIKYGLIRDAEFFDWLETNMDGLLKRNPELLVYAIERCCKNKADIVAADELETGVRALLNFGHTFGHAIETATGYTSWLHGEAIAAGMCLAADLSARHGWMSRGDVNRSEALLKRAALPTRPPSDLDSRRFQELMAVDKKTVDKGLRLVLLKGIGNAFVTGDYKPDLLSETLAANHGSN